MKDFLRAPSLVNERIRNEYLEGPGLRLTVGQAARFLGLEPATCERALEELEQNGFLCRYADGSYGVCEDA
jgi:Fic family protein